MRVTDEAYYNEIDPKAAAWLRELIKAGAIAPGYVDERDIRDVRPDDLIGYTQCHFFAGVGIWSYALRSAGWADSRSVWTGSCPCQPFSAAGGKAGFADERHLWPHWHHLISECKPDVVFGEQVASKDGLAWLDLVQADLEGTGYASGSVDLCAAGVGAPHIRQRLWFVAERLGHADRARAEAGIPEPAEWQERYAEVDDHGGDRLLRPGARRPESGGLADSDGRDTSAERQQPSGQHGQQQKDGSACGVADSEREQRIWRRSGEASDESRPEQRIKRLCDAPEGEPPTGPTNGMWRAADWLFCRDGKWRPVEPGTFPLAHGAAARVGRLRGYGNGIVAQVAETFISAAMEVLK